MNVVKAGRPSPAMIVAALALVFAMVGTAVAGTDGISSKLTKSKVKSIAKKQATKIVKANVTGSHVNTADNATSAGNAGTVDGNSLIKVFAKVPVGATNQVIGTFGPITIEADCTGAGNDVENLEVVSSIGDIAMVAQGNGEGAGTTGPTEDEDQGGTVLPRRLNLDSGQGNDNDRGMATFSWSRTNGDVITGEIGYDDPNLYNGEVTCAVFGHVEMSG